MGTETLDTFPTRALTLEECRALEQNGCRADCWETVRVAEGFDPARCRDVTFGGIVRLGRFDASIAHEGLFLPCGIEYAHLIDCSIGDNARIAHVGLLARMIVEPGVCIQWCNEIATPSGSTFGQGVPLDVWNEAGLRPVPLCDRLSAPLAYWLAALRHRPALVHELEQHLAAAILDAAEPFGRIGAGASLQHCRCLRGVRIGSAAQLHGCDWLEDGSIVSRPDAPAHVGHGVQARQFVIQTDARVESGAQLSATFVGQGARMGHGFSSTHSAWFANCEAYHGEACSLLAGPFTVTHHKSTLLIAAATSFFNAGSNSNQSNHLYKTGPVHQGLFERGSKTGSGSYCLWPGQVGPFSIVIGKHRRHLDARALPFSYLLENDGDTLLIPARNLFTIGTWRDGCKWLARDRRHEEGRLDPVHPQIASPWLIDRMISAVDILRDLQATPSGQTAVVRHNGMAIKRAHLPAAIRQYSLGIRLALGEMLLGSLEQSPLPADSAPIKWQDWLGFLVPAQAGETLLTRIESGEVNTLSVIESALQELNEHSTRAAAAWLSGAWQRWFGSPLPTHPEARRAALTAWSADLRERAALLEKDMEKEFDPALPTGGAGDLAEDDARCDDIAVHGDRETHTVTQQIRAEAADLLARAARV